MNRNVFNSGFSHFLKTVVVVVFIDVTAQRPDGREFAEVVLFTFVSPLGVDIVHFVDVIDRIERQNGSAQSSDTVFTVVPIDRLMFFNGVSLVNIEPVKAVEARAVRLSRADILVLAVFKSVQIDGYVGDRILAVVVVSVVVPVMIDVTGDRSQF